MTPPADILPILSSTGGKKAKDILQLKFFPWALFIILTVIFIACFKFMLQSALHNKEIISEQSAVM